MKTPRDDTSLNPYNGVDPHARISRGWIPWLHELSFVEFAIFFGPLFIISLALYVHFDLYPFLPLQTDAETAEKLVIFGFLGLIASGLAWLFYIRLYRK